MAGLSFRGFHSRIRQTYVIALSKWLERPPKWHFRMKWMLPSKALAFNKCALLRSFHKWQNFSYYAAGWVQIGYLALVSLTVMVDSVATLTFRWKEYGELTHGQTDATSIVFFLCKSR